jgi:hypothetical protein
MLQADSGHSRQAEAFGRLMFRKLTHRYVIAALSAVLLPLPIPGHEARLEDGVSGEAVRKIR